MVRIIVIVVAVGLVRCHIFNSGPWCRQAPVVLECARVHALLVERMCTEGQGTPGYLQQWVTAAAAAAAVS